MTKIYKDKELPKFLLDKRYLTVSVFFILTFSVLFMAIYSPFSSTAWFSLTNLEDFGVTAAFYIVELAILSISKLIMYNSLEFGKEPDITRGTIEGDLIPGAVTIFRLQSTADAKLRAYVAQGDVLPVPTRSFGSIGIIGIPEMERFYRYELIENNYPHHGAVAFDHIGNTLYELFRYLGVTEIGYNRAKGDRYPTEKPFR